MFEDRSFTCTVYQCISCRLTSPHKHNVASHLPRCEPGATIVQAKSVVQPVPARPTVAVNRDTKCTKMLEVLCNDLADMLLSLDLKRPETWRGTLLKRPAHAQGSHGV